MSEGVGRNRKQIDVKYALVLLMILSFGGCASEPLTEEQREEKEYWEQERQLAYLQWKTNCIVQRKIVFIYNAISPCSGRDCIPRRWDWRYDFDRERPMHGNAYQCISRADLREIMRRL